MSRKTPSGHPIDNTYEYEDAGSHDYSEGPPVEPWHGKASVAADTAARAHSQRSAASDHAIASIGDTIRTMPFTGLVGVNRPLVHQEVDEYLTWLAIWLESYARVIKGQVDSYAHTAGMLARLETERDAVRAFFGLPVDQ